MEAINQEDLQVPENVDIPVDPDAATTVEPNFADLEASEPEQKTEPSDAPEEPAEEPTSDNDTPETPEESEGSEPEPTQTPESSLQDEPTPEPEPTPEEPVSEPEVNLDDEAVAKYLSEKLGKEVTSLEDLVKEPEDPFKGDEDLKALAEWRERTGRPLSDWAKFQKDYGAMSHEDVAREYLRYKYEDFTPEEIELELQQYLPGEDDLDNEAARKRLNLKKLAADGRRELGELRMELDKPVPAKLSQDQLTAIEYYQKAQEQQAQAQKVAQLNDKNLNKAIETTETLEIELDKDNSIEFKPRPEARKSLRDFMKMPNWYNQDGTLNAQEVVKDSFFLQNRENIIQEAFKQGLAQGEAAIEKETNNVTLDGRKTAEGQAPQKSDIVIEGLEDMQGMQLKWR